jgi:hypothetical protein
MEELIHIYNKQEVMWQIRGGERWLLEGDANTAYFHGVANGRKKEVSDKISRRKWRGDYRS